MLTHKLHRYSVLVLSILISLLAFTPTIYAATIKSGSSLYLSEEQENLKDVYLFGESITSDAIIENDLVAAGADITLNGDVTGSVMAAGGDIAVRSNVSNTMRLAGGKIAVSGKIQRDLLIIGGSARITNTASVSGDVLFLGGELEIDGPVAGVVYANGGNVVINNTVGSIQGTIGALKLEKNAIVKGDMQYTSEQKATIQNGALVQGKHEFTKAEPATRQPNSAMSALTVGSIYKLIADIAVSFVLLFLLGVFIRKVFEYATASPLTSAGTGFIFLFLWPILSLFLLFFIWLGIISFIAYGLTIIIVLFLSKLFIGWLSISWWEKRQNKDKESTLDWRAAVVGPLIMYVLFLVPVIGWIITGIIYLITLGGVIKYMTAFIKTQKENSSILKKSS